MKRSKAKAKDNAPKKVSWLKKSGGDFTVPSTGKVIKTGTRFEAEESEIPKAFADMFERISSEEVEEEGEELFYLVQVEGGYNVVGDDEVAVNEAPLSKEEADKLLSEMNEK